MDEKRLETINELLDAARGEIDGSIPMGPVQLALDMLCRAMEEMVAEWKGEQMGGRAKRFVRRRKVMGVVTRPGERPVHLLTCGHEAPIGAYDSLYSSTRNCGICAGWALSDALWKENHPERAGARSSGDQGGAHG
jgi:hypothetical protein